MQWKKEITCLKSNTPLTRTYFLPSTPAEEGQDSLNTQMSYSKPPFNLDFPTFRAVRDTPDGLDLLEIWENFLSL